MTTLTITRGLPGSGKSTWARQQQETKPGLWRVNRDDLRAMLVPAWAFGDQNDEDLLTVVQHRAVHALLYNGIDVIVDDTNLSDRAVKGLREVADDNGATFVIQDFTGVPLETCLARDAARPNPVGEQVIRRMWHTYLAPTHYGDIVDDSLSALHKGPKDKCTMCDPTSDSELAAEDTAGMQPCQPIGCDNGYHLAGCRFADIDAAEPDGTEVKQS